ncbi:hypothetical protein ZWY2020_010027 [Hordeum vulgare]|nr:hypothetical protein ZWY2020_010027 [Hordeum vulgare]
MMVRSSSRTARARETATVTVVTSPNPNPRKRRERRCTTRGSTGDVEKGHPGHDRDDAVAASPATTSEREPIHILLASKEGLDLEERRLDSEDQEELGRRRSCKSTQRGTSPSRLEWTPWGKREILRRRL